MAEGLFVEISEQVLPLEKEKVNSADRNAGIGEIEYGAEKDKSLSSLERDPFRKSSINYGKVEHVYHLAHKERCVSAAFGQKSRGIEPCRLTEKLSVKNAVYHISYGSYKHKGDSHKQPRGNLLFFQKSSFYEEDYQSITSYFTEDFVSYEDTIKNMRKIIQDISF